MLKRRDHVKSFEARNGLGQTRTLHVIVDIIAVPPVLGQSHPGVPGLDSLVTDDGELVGRLEKGKYRVPSTGEILQSDDPDAP